jgi:hypothetical protein
VRSSTVFTGCWQLTVAAARGLQLALIVVVLLLLTALAVGHSEEYCRKEQSFGASPTTLKTAANTTPTYHRCVLCAVCTHTWTCWRKQRLLLTAATVVQSSSKVGEAQCSC